MLSEEQFQTDRTQRVFIVVRVLVQKTMVEIKCGNIVKGKYDVVYLTRYLAGNFSVFIVPVMLVYINKDGLVSEQSEMVPYESGDIVFVVMIVSDKGCVAVKIITCINVYIK